MIKISQIRPPLLKNFESLINFFKDQKPKKYLNSLVINYLQFVLNDLEKNYAKISPILLSSFEDKYNKLLRFIEALRENSFFKTYGHYFENSLLINDFLLIINEILDISKPFLVKINFSKLSFEKSLMKSLDSAIEKVQNRENDLKKKKPKKLERISEELTYIFWFSGLEKESSIDDKTFLKHLEKVLKVIGLDINRMNRKTMLDEVDKERNGAISAEDIQEFFVFGLTDPSSYVYFLPGNEKDYDNEDSDEKYKKKKQKKNKKIAEKDEKDEKTTDKKVKIHKKIIEKNENKVKFNIFEEEKKEKNAYKDEEDNKKKKENSQFHLANQKLEKSVKIWDFLNLIVLEVNDKETLLKPGVKIRLDSSSFSIDNCPKQPLFSKFISKFGRKSDFFSEENADITFANGLLTVSRKQFQITNNDEVSGVYKIICTSLPPKPETSFKISAEPFRLSDDLLINLTRKEAIWIEEFYDGFQVSPEEKSEESDEDTSFLQKKRKKESDFMKKTLLSKVFDQNIKPFIVLAGISDNSESQDHVFRIEFDEKKEEYEIKKGVLKNEEFMKEKTFIQKDGFIFGRDWIFIEKNANTEAKIYFEKGMGWFIKGFDIKDKRFKEVQTLISVSNYGRILEGKNSQPVVLEENMIIHIDGYSFLIEKN